VKAIANDVIMPFGKYKGKTLGEIADIDLLYLDWLNDPSRKIKSKWLILSIAEICAERAHEIDNLVDES